MKKNIIFVVSHPIQYFVPLYQEMAKNEEAHVKVLYCTDETMKGGIDKMFGVKVKWDIPLLDGYESKFMTNHAFKPNMNTFWGLLNLGLIKELWKAPKSLVIINGWQFSTYVMAYFFARLFGHKVGTRSEAPFYKEFNRPSISKSIRKFVLGNLLFKYFIDFFFYIGNQNKKFYQYFNVKDNQLFYAPYAVDNERFMRATNLSDAEKTALKQELNIPEQSHIALFTGKFYSVKRPLDLLEAIKNLNQPDLYLVMVGDGILRPEMEEFIKAHNLTNVRITGFVNQTQMNTSTF